MTSRGHDGIRHLTGLRVVRSALGRVQGWMRKTVITEATGMLEPSSDQACALLVVGRNFDQRIPDAMMTCRMGYARAFEALGIPYLICDWRNVPQVIARLPRSFAIVFGSDVAEMNAEVRSALAAIPNAVWVNPWFDGEQSFFAGHGLQAGVWVWPSLHRKAVLELAPRFGFTATVPTGLNFFASWEREGVVMRSLPLACDTSLYNHAGPADPAFSDVKLAFVGGYWTSKGRAIDHYLRPFERQLTVYGYNRWPYEGYRGQLERHREPMLYRQALVCPVVNEPTVALLKGQINERIFKVLGCGGVPVVDAVPAYRELFTEAELMIPRDEVEFGEQVRRLLVDPSERKERAQRGRAAVLERHTYVHRAKAVLAGLGFDLAKASARL